MKSIEMTGKTVEDAVRAGLKELGCDSSDVTIDVLHMGSPGLFGMFGKLAKVRLTMKEEDPELDFDLSDMNLSLNQAKAPKARAEKPAKAEKAEKTEKAEKKAPASAAKAAPVTPVEPAKASRNAQQPDKPVRAEEAAPAAPRREETASAAAAETLAAQREETVSPAREERAPRGEKASAREEHAPIAQRPAIPFEETNPETLSEAGRAAYDFLANVTHKMGVDVRIQVVEEEGHIYAAMMGDTLGILIGRRGDTLDALQYLTSLQVNKHREGYIRVSLDTENYREKREEALGKLALRMASRVRKTGHKVTLEPMNPYERRVLHSALQNHPYVTTHSEGEEPYRHVVITLRENSADA